MNFVESIGIVQWVSSCTLVTVISGSNTVHAKVKFMELAYMHLRFEVKNKMPSDEMRLVSLYFKLEKTQYPRNIGPH